MDGVAWSVSQLVCVFVCLSVMTMCPAKMAEPIKMPFGMWTQMDRRNY